MRHKRLGVSPARHALSDSRINSSHGNNIFISQGQKIVLFPSSFETVDDMFGAQCCSLWLQQKLQGRSLHQTYEGKKNKLKVAGKLVSHYNLFRKIRKRDPVPKAELVADILEIFKILASLQVKERAATDESILSECLVFAANYYISL